MEIYSPSATRRGDDPPLCHRGAFLLTSPNRCSETYTRRQCTSTARAPRRHLRDLKGPPRNDRVSGTSCDDERLQFRPSRLDDARPTPARRPAHVARAGTAASLQPALVRGRSRICHDGIRESPSSDVHDMPCTCTAERAASFASAASPSKSSPSNMRLREMPRFGVYPVTSQNDECEDALRDPARCSVNSGPMDIYSPRATRRPHLPFRPRGSRLNVGVRHSHIRKRHP